MKKSPPKLLHGAVVPMVTPFTPAGQLDETAVSRLLDHLIAGGVHGVLLLGTTGEEASLPLPLRRQLVAVATAHARDRLAVYAGISDNALGHAVEAAETYHALGVTALVAHLPSYYELHPHEMLAYYQRLLALISGRLVIYNIPITTHMSIPLDVIEALSEHPQVVGIKDSERDLPRFLELLRRLGEHPTFSVMGGAGAFFDQAMNAGADGFVPTAGNLLPALCQQVYQHAQRGEAAAVTTCQEQLLSLASLYNPGHTVGQTFGLIKSMLGVWDICSADVLPPLVTPSAAEQAGARNAFSAWLAAHA